MATLQVAGTLSASPSTLTLAESQISDGNSTRGLLVADSGCLSPARSEFSSSVTLADEKDTRDETFTVRSNDESSYLAGLTRQAGDVGWARRPREPQKLDHWAEVGGKSRCPFPGT